ncbi:MAG: 4Fe-4S binding protein [Bacteroidales bacterium]|nr:4Fe-4S binding protein [Bacteroidales bacterium]
MAAQETFFGHSLKVDKNRCLGCTTCMRSCPTGAIRIRGGKAEMNDNKCVDCGNCMKVCPHKAIYIQQDDFALIHNYKYRVCLVPTTFIGQFEEKFKTREIYACLKKLGFTHIYEVEHEVEYIVELYNKYIAKHPEIQTFISPYCPAVIRLIQVRFPSLVDNIIKIRAPFELAAHIMTNRLMDEGADREDIGVFYVTPCAAKIAAVKYPVSNKETCITGVINMDFLYNKVQLMLRESKKDAEAINHSLTSRDVLWPLPGGEASLFNGSHYAVDGLQNVLNFLERLEDEAIDAQGLVEMRMCDQGCVGGVLATNNRFVARKRLEDRARVLDKPDRPLNRYTRYNNPEFCKWIDGMMEIDEITPHSIYKLDDNFSEAIKMAERMKKIEKALPGVNCSACGAPSCAALAEDIVRGDADISSCMFINRHTQASEDAIRNIWGDRIKTKTINNDKTE